LITAPATVLRLFACHVVYTYYVADRCVRTPAAYTLLLPLCRTVAALLLRSLSRYVTRSRCCRCSCTRVTVVSLLRLCAVVCVAVLLPARCVYRCRTLFRFAIDRLRSVRLPTFCWLRRFMPAPFRALRSTPAFTFTFAPLLELLRVVRCYYRLRVVDHSAIVAFAVSCRSAIVAIRLRYARCDRFRFARLRVYLFVTRVHIRCRSALITSGVHPTLSDRTTRALRVATLFALHLPHVLHLPVLDRCTCVTRCVV